MDLNELLALMTLGAVAPYVTAAAACWIKRSGEPPTGADAPTWCHFRKRRQHPAGCRRLRDAIRL